MNYTNINGTRKMLTYVDINLSGDDIRAIKIYRGKSAYQSR
jgi:hypothetical protein